MFVVLIYLTIITLLVRQHHWSLEAFWGPSATEIYLTEVSKVTQMPNQWHYTTSDGFAHVAVFSWHFNFHIDHVLPLLLFLVLFLSNSMIFCTFSLCLHVNRPPALVVSFRSQLSFFSRYPSFFFSLPFCKCSPAFSVSFLEFFPKCIHFLT